MDLARPSPCSPWPPAKGDAGPVVTPLGAMVAVARRSAVGVDEVGVSLVGPDCTVVTSVSTGPLVAALDTVQRGSGDGPSLARRRRDHLVVLEHLRDETRWRPFVAAAVGLGVTAHLGATFVIDRHTTGVLSFCSTSGETVAARTRYLAPLFAAHASLAYGHADAVRDLCEALDPEEPVGTAVEVTMDRYGLGPARAFDYLVQTSWRSALSVHELAEEVVAHAGRGRPSTRGTPLRRSGAGP